MNKKILNKITTRLLSIITILITATVCTVINASYILSILLIISMGILPIITNIYHHKQTKNKVNIEIKPEEKINYSSKVIEKQDKEIVPIINNSRVNKNKPKVRVLKK